MATKVCLILLQGGVLKVTAHETIEAANMVADNSNFDDGWVIRETAHLDELSLEQLTEVYKYVSPQGPALDPAGDRSKLNDLVWAAMQQLGGSTSTTEAPAPGTQATPQEEEHVTTATAAPGKPGAKKTAAKKSAATKGNGTAKRGAVAALKKIMLKNPNITMDKLESELKGKGFTPSRSTIDSFAADFRNSLRVLKEQGYDVPVPGATA